MPNGQRERDILFKRLTRKNVKTFANRVYAKGNVDPIYLPRTGLLAKVYVRFEGTLTCTHASKTSFTRAQGAPYNLFSKLHLDVNGGTDIFKASGYSTYIRNLLDVLENKAGSIVAGRDVFEFANVVSSAGTANNLKFTLEIPIMVNERDLVGLILLQNPEILATLRLEMNGAEVLMTETDITSVIAGNISITMEYFDVPDNADARPDLRVIHRILEEQEPIAAVGTHRYRVPCGNLYQRLIHRVILNGTHASDANVETLSLTYNQGINPFSIDASIQRYLQRKRYGQDLPLGVYVHDFGYQGIPVLSDGRDYIDSSYLTEFWSSLQIASGATLGTNNNHNIVLREELVPMQSAR